MSHSFESTVRAASLRFALAALGTAAAVHGQTQPGTLYVDASAPAGGNGQSWTAALRDVQDAIFFADLRPDRSQQIVIKLGPGVYKPDAGTLSRNMSFVLNSGVSLAGGFAGRLSATPDENDPARFVSVLSGDLAGNDSPGISTRTDNSQVVVTVSNTNTAISGVTIRGGTVALQQNGSGPLFLSRCTITDNNSSSVNNPFYYTYSAVVNIRNATLDHCSIIDNLTTQIPTMVGSNVFMHACTVAGNASVRGGGQSQTLFPIRLSASCTLDACLIAANVSSDYGPWLYNGDFALFNCTIADNVTQSASGARIEFATFCSLTNCVISLNYSQASAGDIQIVSLNSPHPSFVSCFLDHGATDISITGGTITSSGLLSGDAHFANSAGPDQLSLNWHDNDYRLAPSSPCIDRGNTSASFYLTPHTDLLDRATRDNPATPNLGTGPITYLDLGCFEYAPPACPADFNASGSITAQDIFDFLGAWFALNPAADFNTSGAITAQDIFDFLSAWFAGC